MAQEASSHASLPLHICLAVFDGSAVPPLVDYSWNQTCRCKAHLVPTTVDPQDYRRCRLCQVMARLGQMQSEWNRKISYRLWQCRADWVALTERERAKWQGQKEGEAA